MAVGGHLKDAYLKKVGPNLYRATTGTYYLLVKRGGKQFRRSLRTTDQALAKRRLREFQEKATRLSGDNENRKDLRFERIGRSLAGIPKRGELKSSSYGIGASTALKGLSPFFDGHLVRAVVLGGNRELEIETRGIGPVGSHNGISRSKPSSRYSPTRKDDLRILIDKPTIEPLRRRKERKAGQPSFLPRSNSALCWPNSAIRSPLNG